MSLIVVARKPFPIYNLCNIVIQSFVSQTLKMKNEPKKNLYFGSEEKICKALQKKITSTQPSPECCPHMSCRETRTQE